MLSSCGSDEAAFGTGTLNLKVSVNSDVVIARSADDDLAENCTIYVYSGETLVRKFHGLGEVPTQGMVLTSGLYTVQAWAGENVPASFTQKYYKGEGDFTVTKGANVTAEIVCNIANVVSSVTVDESAQAVLKDYNVSIGHSKGLLDFNASNTDAKGYYMMPDEETDLTWTITGKQLNGSDFTQTGVISNVKPAHEYSLTVKYDEKTQSLGGMYFTIEVDETEIVVNDEHVIIAPPHISASGFDINEPQIFEPQGFQKMILYACAASKLTECVVSSDAFTSMGLPATSFDVLGISPEVKSQLAALGFTSEYVYNEATDNAATKVSISETLLNKLPLGDYKITIKATDVNGRTSVKDCVFSVSSASVITNAADPSKIKCYSATLSGSIARAESTGFGFNYRKVGETAWQTVSATVSGNSFSATIKELSAATTYEFAAICDGFVGKVLTFTTGTALQLPNSGFEDWFTDSDKAIVPAAGASSLFWDCGNHGSITLNVNVTTPESNIKHSGKYSAKLQSAYVALMGIGKLAAGNVFVGKYLGTSGTNGIIGYGRPFNARPVALHGYVKYVPGKVDYTSSEVPDLKAGENDWGFIYVAMMDNDLETYNGSQWPMVIKTKASERRLFDPNEPKVLGFGELRMNQPTQGDGLVEFTIPIEYKNGLMPSNIILTCAASAYGDFFAGSSTSVMYVDDLELIYE